MQTININQALPQITQLLEIASTGEEVIITKNNQPMVKLVSTNQLENNEMLTSSNLGKSLEKIIQSTAENDKKLTPKERVKIWLDFVATLPKTSANLPDEALHRESMYD
jgi:prevent-host-death family protein